MANCLYCFPQFYVSCCPRNFKHGEIRARRAIIKPATKSALSNLVSFIPPYRAKARKRRGQGDAENRLALFERLEKKDSALQSQVFFPISMNEIGLNTDAILSQVLGSARWDRNLTVRTVLGAN